MIGVDIVVVSRIENSIQKHGEKFLRRYLNDEEIALIHKTETAAGFWAAKEAVAKAIGTGIGTKVGFHDIIIGKTPQGAPFFELPQNLMEELHIETMSLSIAHDGGFAIAVAAIERSTSSDEV